MSAEFCDTNVLAYAYDRSAGVKRDRAKQCIDRLWHQRNGVVSIQVLQELFVTLTRKTTPRLSNQDARIIVEDIATWQVVEPNADDVIEAINAADRWQVSFWDAMILIAAKKAGATAVWSEDLNAGQSYGEVEVRNPFER